MDAASRADRPIARSRSGTVAAALRRADGLVDHATQVAVAALLAVELGLLSAGVAARYAFHRPLVWSDELATTLFLWLTMLGAALALRRSQHLRLTVLVNSARPAIRDAMVAMTAALTVVFALAIGIVGWIYVQDSAALTLPSLGLSASWRTAAMPAGALLMVEVALVQGALTLPRLRPGAVAGAAMVLVAIGLALWLPGDALADLDNWNLLIFFVGLVGFLLLIGLPIAFAFALVTLAYLAFTTDTPLSVVLGRMDGGMSDIILLSIPLFVFLGKAMEATGMAEALVSCLAAMLSHIRGGLSYALLAAMYVVSGISGAKTADMAAVAPLLFPEMKARGGRDGEMIALLAASAVMSETIPPSLVLIAIATTVGVSISALFTAGLLPALVAAVALCGLVWFRSRNQAVGGRRPPAGQILKALVTALPGLALPFIIRAAVVEGVATATEVSTVGIVYTLIVGAILYRLPSWRRVYDMLVQTAVLSGMVLLILGGANAMAWGLTQSGFSDQLAQVLTHMPGGKFGFLATAILIFIVFGSVLEGLPAIALFGPLLFPIARTLGLHEVHFAIVAILSMGIGLYMPPFGVGYYSACAIGHVNPDAGMRAIWPYMAMLLGVVLLIAAVPALSTLFLR